MIPEILSEIIFLLVSKMLPSYTDNSDNSVRMQDHFITLLSLLSKLIMVRTTTETSSIRLLLLDAHRSSNSEPVASPVCSVAPERFYMWYTL